MLELVDCTAPTACAASAGLAGRLFTEDIPGGKRADVFTAFGDGASCALAARRIDAIIAPDATLHLETRRYEERDLSGVVCTGATARTMLGSLPCLELDLLTATLAP
ncbi:MAG TPA: hypothetical protein VHE35_32665 [Kofleriaceae bacterium]|nr:hypothetical protein [Kofleriaceae bacterium]